MFIPFMRFLLRRFGFEKFSRSFEEFFPEFFLRLCLIDDVRFQYSQILAIFLFF